MSKFFKYLSIGSAIGVVAYGVIKYKNDQKFKEKVNEVAEGVKNTGEKAIIKAADFTAEHPVITSIGFFGILAFCRVMRSYQCELARQEYYSKYDDNRNVPDGINEEYDRLDETAADTAKRIISEHYGDDNVDLSNYLVVPKDEYEKYQKAYETKAEPKTEENSRGWKEDYREKWDKVNEFAKTLDLVDGESFWIDEPSQYDVEGDKPIVSHMIYGEGCYPPEDS